MSRLLCMTSGIGMAMAFGIVRSLCLLMTKTFQISGISLGSNSNSIIIILLFRHVIEREG